MREGIVICALAVVGCSAAHAEQMAVAELLRFVALASLRVAPELLPAGCVFATGVYTCGTTRYRRYYDGPTVVYQAVD